MHDPDAQQSPRVRHATQSARLLARKGAAPRPRTTTFTVVELSSVALTRSRQGWKHRRARERRDLAKVPRDSGTRECRRAPAGDPNLSENVATRAERRKRS